MKHFFKKNLKRDICPFCNTDLSLKLLLTYFVILKKEGI